MGRASVARGDLRNALLEVHLCCWHLSSICTSKDRKFG